MKMEFEPEQILRFQFLLNLPMSEATAPQSAVASNITLSREGGSSGLAVPWSPLYVKLSVVYGRGGLQLGYRWGS
jgi:hypothetical protein